MDRLALWWRAVQLEVASPSEQRRLPMPPKHHRQHSVARSGCGGFGLVERLAGESVVAEGACWLFLGEIHRYAALCERLPKLCLLLGGVQLTHLHNARRLDAILAGRFPPLLAPGHGAAPFSRNRIQPLNAMNKGPNFLTIKDLMTLMGTNRYNTA
jgi:hypothetical protein